MVVWGRMLSAMVLVGFVFFLAFVFFSEVSQDLPRSFMSFFATHKYSSKESRVPEETRSSLGSVQNRLHSMLTKTPSGVSVQAFSEPAHAVLPTTTTSFATISTVPTTLVPAASSAMEVIASTSTSLVSPVSTSMALVLSTFGNDIPQVSTTSSARPSGAAALVRQDFPSGDFYSASTSAMIATSTAKSFVAEVPAGSRNASDSPGPLETLSIAAKLCSSRHRPMVAVCFYGALKYFDSDIVHTSQRENLIDAMGVDATAFLHLTYDNKTTESMEPAMRGARVLNISRGRMLLKASADVRLPKCDASPPELSIAAMEFSHRNGCMVLIEQEELRLGKKFEQVIFSHADLVFCKPMASYCVEKTEPVRRWQKHFFQLSRAEAPGISTTPYQKLYACGALAKVLSDVQRAEKLPSAVDLSVTVGLASRSSDACSVLVSRGLSRQPPRSSSIAAKICSGSEEPRPLVAFCLHGTARSFPHDLVHSSHRHNFMDAYGADVTAFLHIVLADGRGDGSKQNGGLFPTATRAQIMYAARLLNISEERMWVADGPNMPPPTCREYQFNNAHKYGGHMASLAGQLSHRNGCFQLIKQEESRAGRQFDQVALVRADTTFYAPFPAYCTFEYKKSVKCWDWAFLVPRSIADKAFQEPYDDLYGCRRVYKGGPAETYYMRAGPLKDVTDNRGQWKLMVTRMDRKDMPHNLDGFFFFKGKDLFPDMTYRNPYNRLPVLADGSTP
eukprot:TRINITY_DN1607_c0_g2_i1.p1 TRINITY_DN1607_c0_g2~~TRINITY_DN1607_c0_g2_i1.p1  ORF type:complete len:731 (+),score=111.95 TRINITY_DN1607_c0_g2_i1:191-2383(+)